MERCEERFCKFFGKELITVVRQIPFDTLIMCEDDLAWAKKNGYKKVE